MTYWGNMCAVPIKELISLSYKRLKEINQKQEKWAKCV